MDVICEIKEYSEPSKGIVKIRSRFADYRMIEIEVDGKGYIVNAEELISAAGKATLNVMGY